MKKLLEINNLKASIIEDKKEILKNVNLVVNSGEIHAIMGPNGSGKSTLANVIMGSPKYQIESGKILFENKLINNLSTEKRAKLGLFMSFQAPEEISGVKMRQFLLNSYRNIHSNDSITALNLSKKISEYTETVKLNSNFLNRYVNQGFSGGERKKSEILQMGLLSPKLVILDEIDSGLDVDALKTVANSINKFKNEKMAIIIITHYQRILNYIKPDFVHVYDNGKIVSTGNFELAKEIENNGYSILNNIDGISSFGE